ncbi:MAG: tetratricopeptide repeat protein, partial [Deltaproteobacteria bacterium]|nr:tetratricopeptide repeat protein [Deltaproteobacteria bacterium]
GAAAVDAGRWSDAVASFRSAYELTHAPSALFNTGFALRALGRYREARDAFVELATLDNVSDAMSTQGEELLAEVRLRIARVRLGGLEEEPRYGVRLDGVGVEDLGTRPMILEADPGTHAVDVSLTGYEPFTWSGQLADGALIDVPVVLTQLAVQGGGGGGSVAEEAWFWLLIGGLVAVGAGLATYFILDDQAQLRGQSDMVVRL